MSRYQVSSGVVQGETAYRLADTDRQAEAVVYPALGNNCVAFRTTPDVDGPSAAGGDDAPVDLLLPPDNILDLRDHPAHGGNPILFPFPNRVRAGVYTFEGRIYKMEQLLAKHRDRQAGHAIHGLAGDKPWTVEEANADATGAMLRSSLQMDAFPDIVAQYPFPCRITVTYRLREGVLEMQTEVVNTGSGRLPMGFGIHPWFPTRLQPGAVLPGALADITPEQRAQAQVQVPADALWELEQWMPTGAIVSVDADPDLYDLRAFRPLDGHYYDHLFTRVRRDATGWSEGGLRDPTTGLEMSLAADAGFREWVLYAPASRPVVALEPYTCTTDAVNLEARGIDAGLIVLAPGQTWGGLICFGLRRH